MTLIDLTDESAITMPVIGMVTRFPPSESAAAPAALELVRRLREVHGYPVEVVRLMEAGEGPSGGDPVVMDLSSRWRLGADLAVRRIRRCDVALVQVDRHVPLEVADDLTEGLDIPVVLSLDEVAPPDSQEIRWQAELAAKAATTVVSTDVAKTWLEAEAASGVEIEVVPHASAWQPFEPGEGPRRNILTWGFVGPGLGAERVCRALALLDDLRPLPRYRLVGVTDPSASRAEVADYRRLLLGAAKDAGVADRFEMSPFLHSREDLGREIERADVIAVVYDAQERACSRILSEAVTTGRPVVATRFPGAVDLLSAGMGVTVPHDDDVALAEALRTYLTDEYEYRRASAAGTAIGAKLSWDVAAQKYAALLARALGRHGPLVRTRP